MPQFDIIEKRLRINIFKISGAYYFKYFFDDRELFRELEHYYEKPRYRFKMPTSGERNKIMKLLDRKGYDPTIIEDPAPYIVGISRSQKYGELRRCDLNSGNKPLLTIRRFVFIGLIIFIHIFPTQAAVAHSHSNPEGVKCEESTCVFNRAGRIHT